MNRYLKILTPVFFIFLLFAAACNDGVPNVSLGINDTYKVERMKAIRFTPGYTGTEYKWTMKLPNGTDSLLSTERNYTFVQKDEGTYNLSFEIIDASKAYKHDFSVTVVHEEVEYSAYISKVYEYKPAPGQFVNEIPKYEMGDTEETMRIKVQENLSGTNDVMITLGGYGGYVTFGFDHTVMNVEGERDFLVLGNALYSWVEDGSGRKGGSSEPGIVMVAFDKNQNGVADEDEWYELAGSEYYKSETVKEYEITYYRPDPNKEPTPSPTIRWLSDTTYIKWTDNLGTSGYIEKNTYHTQDYYPKWINSDQLTFRGTRLAKNGVDISGNGSYWVLYPYDWGYADNKPNAEIENNSFDIDWAVDKNGNRVKLPGVDFIRVYTAINQSCGWVGETSTEILRAQDLHIE